MGEFINVLFLGDSGHIAGEVVQLFTNSKWTHVGIVIDGEVYEAIQPCVTKRPLSIYDGMDYTIREVYLPDYESAVIEASRLIGTPYGLLTDCVSGGLYDILKIGISNGVKTLDCSEYVTRVLISGGLNVYDKMPPDSVTPIDLYNYINSLERDA